MGFIVVVDLVVKFSHESLPITQVFYSINILLGMIDTFKTLFLVLLGDLEIYIP